MGPAGYVRVYIDKQSGRGGIALLPDKELASLRSRFLRFAQEARGRSPLYEKLSLAIADEDEIVSLLAIAAERQRRPNLLFAAVHDLLLGGADHELATYYPSVSGDREPDARTFSVFRSFLQHFNSEIVHRLGTHTTQTNEPGRCAALRAGLGRLATHADRPVALLELGASAGLLLHLDRYRYRYGEVEIGPQGSDVTISPELRGPPPQDLTLPTIAQRIGIDLDPLDPSDPATASWLKACVWPEDIDRLRRLEAALSIASANDDIRFVTADLVEVLEPAVREVNSDLLVCVMHSAAFAYLDEATFHHVEGTLERLGAERDLARLAFEAPFLEPFVTLARSVPGSEPDEEIFLLGLSTWSRGVRRDELLARAHPHGAWIDWLGPKDTPLSVRSR